MDINNLSPDTIITEEMLNPKEYTRILVITNPRKEFEKIKYNGESELEAYKKFKSINHNDKIIIRALVTYSDFFRPMYDMDVILNYKELEKLY